MSEIIREFDYQLEDIKIGDILTLEPIDLPSERIEEIVTSIKNPNYHEDDFQIRTTNLDYDFINFYSIIKIT